MSDRSAIEWTDATWSPVTGCDRVSPGCDHCYALTLAKRLKAMGSAKYQRDGDPRTSGPGFGVAVHEDTLTLPLRWRAPRRVFVNSMSDLFHQQVPDEFIAQVFAAMGLARRHTFQVLTKRHGRMRSLLSRQDFREAVAEHGSDLIGAYPWRRGQVEVTDWTPTATGDGDTLWSPPWPLPNVWLGVSVENQKWANIRIPALLGTPAAVRFLSCEPLLGPVDLHWCGGVDAIERDWIGGPTGGTGAPHPFVDWVIVGGESGPGARPMHPDWARSLRDQCTAAGVPFFHKQNGAWIEAERDTATHLLQVDGYLVDRKNATADNPYGEGSGLAQDLVDRGHPGWVRVRRVSKHAAGRELDGRSWDEYPQPLAVAR